MIHRAALLLALAGLAPAQKSAPVSYTDIASKSGFTYVSNNHFTGRKYFPQPMCGGVAAIDYDGDGRTDLFFTNGAKFPELIRTDASYHNALLRNRGGGLFEDVTRKAGLEGADLGFCLGVAAGDMDNDGDPDLFLASLQRNALYRNNGDGTFSNITATAGIDTKAKDVISIGGAWLDYDNDGRLDLFVSEYTTWTPATDQRCHRQQLEFYCSPRMYPGNIHRLYRNLGDGKFEDVSAAAGIGPHIGKGMGIGVGDVNGDGLVDIFVANDTERNFLYINRGGRFEESGLAFGASYNEAGETVSSMGCDMKDFDNDGRPDIFYNDLMSQLFGLLRNVAGRYYEYATPRYGIDRLSRRVSGWSPGFVDYDNDGWKDLFSANGDIDDISDNSKQHDTMWRNLEGKAFEDVSPALGKDFLRLGYQRGHAFCDLNGDGFQDIVVTSLNERPRFLISSASNGHHWLLVDLKGTRSNRDAIGARLVLTTASGRKLYNHVSTSVGFMSSSEKRVHFGLGQETAIASVEIHWPSGTVQKIANPAADRVLRVAEPAR